MGRAKVGSVVGTAEGERENVVDGERIAASTRLSAEPANPLLPQHLHAQALIRAVIAARAGAPAPLVALVLGLAAMSRAARRACGPAADDAGTQPTHLQSIASTNRLGASTTASWSLHTLSPWRKT